MNPKEWQIIISDGKTAIKQLHISKLIGYSIGMIVGTSILSVGVMSYLISQQVNENERLHSSIEEMNQRFNIQQEQMIQYDEDRQQIERQLAEMRSMEEQMKELVSDLNPNRIADFSDGPQGGLDEDFSNVGLVKSSELKMNRDYSYIREEASKLVANYQAAVNDLDKVKKDLKRAPIHWPADTETVSSEFGHRSDPFSKVESFHGGIDLAGPLGTEIYATGNGVVEFAGWNGAYGKSILVNHGNSYKTRYSHLADVLIVEGQKVKQGQLIGLMGSTGRSTGVHLHYEVLEDGERVDPFPFMTFIQRALNQ